MLLNTVFSSGDRITQSAASLTGHINNFYFCFVVVLVWMTSEIFPFFLTFPFMNLCVSVLLLGLCIMQGVFRKTNIEELVWIGIVPWSGTIFKLYGYWEIESQEYKQNFNVRVAEFNQFWKGKTSTIPPNFPSRKLGFLTSPHSVLPERELGT